MREKQDHSANGPEPRVLVTTPPLDKVGGVANYCKSLLCHLGDCADSFVVGGRGGRGTLFEVPFRICGDYCRFFTKLTGGKYELVHLNPSLGAKALLRDAGFLLLAKLLRKKVVVLMHGWDLDVERLIRRRFLRAFRGVYFRADAFIVLAESFRKSLREMGYIKPIHTETTVVSDEAFHPSAAA